MIYTYRFSLHATSSQHYIHHKLEALLIEPQRCVHAFYCNQWMAYKLAIHYIRSHNTSHYVISVCISSPEIVCLWCIVAAENCSYSIPLLSIRTIEKSASHESKTIVTTLVNWNSEHVHIIIGIY